MIPEATLRAVDSLPAYDALTKESPELLKSTVMVKLNGGLGTGMGLEKAKSLLELKDGLTFLDFIAKQVVDKCSEADLTPAGWPSKPECEWCPPGHGDLYPAMLGTESLDKLLAQGFKYMFVSNSDNLGATMDVKLLTWFAQSGKPFAMERAQRTDADKKGGHLAKDAKTDGLLLRESAQCPDEDEKEFQNVGKHKYFNTNNLWVNLEALKATMDKHDGVLPLPVMKNGK